MHKSKRCLSCCKKGKNNPQFGKQRGRRILRYGYWYIYKPEHKNATRQGYIAEHRFIIENKISRLLNKNERVHHINGNKRDNREENLILLPDMSEHIKIHIKNFKRDNKGKFI